MANFNLKEGDRSPAIIYTLPVGVDYTGASAVFDMNRRSDGSVKVNAQTALVTTVLVDGVSRDAVQYNWQSADVDEVGFYDAEFTLTYADGRQETVPNVGTISVSVNKKLD